MNEQELKLRLLNAIVSLEHKSKMDRLIYGNAYWEITDRKIELVNPKNIKLKKSMIIVSNQTEKHKPYGKSIVEPLNKMKGGEETNDKI